MFESSQNSYIKILNPQGEWYLEMGPLGSDWVMRVGPNRSREWD